MDVRDHLIAVTTTAARALPQLGWRSGDDVVEYLPCSSHECGLLRRFLAGERFVIDGGDRAGGAEVRLARAGHTVDDVHESEQAKTFFVPTSR